MPPLLPRLLLACLLPSLAFGQTIADERFADGERNNFAPPASLAWRFSHPGNVRLGADGLVLNYPGHGTVAVVAHLTPAGEAIGIPAGGGISAKLRLKSQGPVSDVVNAVRVALLHTGAVRVHRDGTFPTGRADGYMVALNPATGRPLVYKRLDGEGALVAALGKDLYRALSAKGRAAGTPWADGATVEVQLLIERGAAGGNKVTVTVTHPNGRKDVTVRQDESDAPGRFDTLLLGLRQGLSAVTLESVEVEILPPR